MESNDDQNLKAINESVGGLVWVRRRNGSWWPGQTLSHDQVPVNSSLVSPKVGTPIKLLGRDDVNVDWYILEQSKTVKAFRCGDYDACIDKAKAAAVAASSSNKRSLKCTRREDAINSALQIENALVVKEDPPEDNNLCSSSGEEDSKRCLSHEDLGSSDEEETEDELDSAPEQLQSSMSSQEMNNVGASKVQPKRRRRRTPNDSEDDGTEGIKRMRGLEDIGKEQVGGLIEHKQEMGLICDVNLSDSMSNGNILANGNKVCSLASLKRKRSQVVIVNECTKRKNRRRQLAKVLESTAMVSVPVTCDQLVTLDCYDSKVTGMESIESMKSLSVVINNHSDSTGTSCEDAYENVLGASHNKAKDSEISSLSVSAEDDSSDRLFDVPLTGEIKPPPGFPAACRVSSSRKALVTDLTSRRGRSSHVVYVKHEGSNGSACTTSPPVSEPVNFNLNGVEKSTSKWQLKGKRNSRQMSKKQEAKRNEYGEETNNKSSLTHSTLYDVKIEVKANYSKPHNVPLVSRMSKLNGKAIVGHPLTVEILEEEDYCNGKVMMSQVVVKAKKSLSKKKSRKKRKSWKMSKKKKSPPLSVKTRRLSTLTSQRMTERSKKQTTEKAKETVVACIPLKVVFSRINEVLKGSARQTMQHRALPAAAKT